MFMIIILFLDLKISYKDKRICMSENIWHSKLPTKNKQTEWLYCGLGTSPDTYKKQLQGTVEEFWNSERKVAVR